ncbi:MAG: hypothetical protein FJ297_09825 [Planctomycetes bacterium]|nr:hypothetical protein [Planctomycetota bacterium]
MSSAKRTVLRLEIDPIIEAAEAIAVRVQRELPTHNGLGRAASGVAAAARDAKRIARNLHRPWGLHRLPLAFLIVALALIAAWVYWHFVHVATLRIAMPSRDATYLREHAGRGGRIRVREIRTEGSRENLAMVEAGTADVAFVQGGLEIPTDLPRVEIPSQETLLLFVRESIGHPREIKRMLTSVAGQGSHTVAVALEAIWAPERPIEFVHDWKSLTDDPSYTIPADIDGVFVVKDLGTSKVEQAARKLAQAGFRLIEPEIGGRRLTLDYLRAVALEPGFVAVTPRIPAEPLSTFSVATYLVARRDLTPRLLAAAAHLIDADSVPLTARGFEPTLAETVDLVQGVEAFLGIIVYVGVAVLTLLGLEVATYRKRFNELDTLISLISMHQSNKDALGMTDSVRREENLRYLGICSDLLGLVSVIAGYYSQENGSLLYNKLLEIIHHRSSGLKLNIQIKILHVSVPIAERPADSSVNEPQAAFLGNSEGAPSDRASVRPRRAIEDDRPT